MSGGAGALPYGGVAVNKARMKVSILPLALCIACCTSTSRPLIQNNSKIRIRSLQLYPSDGLLSPSSHWDPLRQSADQRPLRALVNTRFLDSNVALSAHPLQYGYNACFCTMSAQVIPILWSQSRSAGVTLPACRFTDVIVCSVSQELQEQHRCLICGSPDHPTPDCPVHPTPDFPPPPGSCPTSPQGLTEALNLVHVLGLPIFVDVLL